MYHQVSFSRNYASHRQPPNHSKKSSPPERRSSSALARPAVTPPLIRASRVLPSMPTLFQSVERHGGIARDHVLAMRAQSGDIVKLFAEHRKAPL
jgi:hypothetical protein